MKRCILFAAGALSWVLPFSAYAQIGTAFETVSPLSASVTGGAWFPRLDTTIKVSAGGLAGSSIDGAGTLGLENEALFAFGAEAILFKNNHVIFNYLALRYRGDKVLTESITFDGVAYTASTRVLSALDADYYRLGYQADIIRNRVLALGFQIDARYVEGRARLRAPSLGLDREKSGRLAFPTVGIAARIKPVPYLSLEGEVNGMSAARYGHLIDGRVSIILSPLRNLGIAGGYRILDIVTKNDGDEARIRLGGPFVSGTLRF